MKQRIFILDPPQINNDFEEYPSHSILPKTGLQDGTDKLLQVTGPLHELTLVTVLPSQSSGQLMLSLSSLPESKYTLKWCSWGTFAVILRLLLFTLQTYYYFSHKEHIIERFGIEYGGNSTLSVTELILTLTIFISDFIGSFVFWKERRGIISFLNSLRQTITVFAEEFKNSKWLEEWFRKRTENTRRLVRVILLSTFTTTVIMSHKDLYQIVHYMLGMSSSNVHPMTWKFPIFASAWFFVLFGRLQFRVWLMSIIDTLQLGFQTVKEHVHAYGQDDELESFRLMGNAQFLAKEFDLENEERKLSFSSRDSKSKSQVDSSMKDYIREIKLNQILNQYRTMEKLLEEFNDLFAPHLLIGIISIVVVMLMALFHFFVELNYKLSATSSIFAIEAVVYTLVLFSMGTAATDMASEADSCITALRDVPLGGINVGLKQKIMLHFQHAMAVPLVVSPGYFFSLNRKMLTSVAGTLTTYLIVLIQFQTSEKPGSSGNHNSTSSEM